MDVLKLKQGDAGRKGSVEGLGQGAQYASVEQDPFIVDDDELEEELDMGVKGRDLEMR